MNPGSFELLRLTLTPGLGPILISRVIERFGSAAAVLKASAADLETIRGIGREKSSKFVQGFRESEALANEELKLAARLGAHLLAKGSPQYPPLLAQIPDAPPILSNSSVPRRD